MSRFTLKFRERKEARFSRRVGGSQTHTYGGGVQVPWCLVMMNVNQDNVERGKKQGHRVEYMEFKSEEGSKASWTLCTGFVRFSLSVALMSEQS